MFEDLEELMDREITKDDLYKGLYFSTAMSGFYVEMIYDAGPMVTVYETASFPSDGYMPSVKRVAGVVFPQEFPDMKLRDIAMDMVADGKTKYIPTHELENWEIKALKDAVMI